MPAGRQQRRVTAEGAALDRHPARIAHALVEHETCALDDVAQHAAVAEVAVRRQQVVAPQSGRAAEVGQEHRITAIDEKLRQPRILRSRQRPRTTVHAGEQRHRRRIAARRQHQVAVQPHAVGGDPADRMFARQQRFVRRVGDADVGQHRRAFAAAWVVTMPARGGQRAVVFADQPAVRRDLQVQRASGQRRLQRGQRRLHQGRQRQLAGAGAAVDRDQRFAGGGIEHGIGQVGFPARIRVQRLHPAVGLEPQQADETGAGVGGQQGVAVVAGREQAATFELHAGHQFAQPAVGLAREHEVPVRGQHAQPQRFPVRRQGRVEDRTAVFMQHLAPALRVEAQQARARHRRAAARLLQQQQRVVARGIGADHFVEQVRVQPRHRARRAERGHAQHVHLLRRGQEQPAAIARPLQGVAAGPRQQALRAGFARRQQPQAAALAFLAQRRDPATRRRQPYGGQVAGAKEGVARQHRRHRARLRFGDGVLRRGRLAGIGGERTHQGAAQHPPPEEGSHGQLLVAAKIAAVIEARASTRAGRNSGE